MTNTIMWFRRDLRVADNHALADAVTDAREHGGGVIPLFVLDDALWGTSGDNRRWFLVGCLRELDEQLTALGAPLVVRHGRPAEVIRELAAEHDVTRVYRAQDVGPYGKRRDDDVAAALAGDAREVVEADTPYAVPAGRLHTASGSTFRVFSPFHRAWRQQRLPSTVRRPSAVPGVDAVRSDGIPDAPAVTADLPEPGEAAGQRALDRFLDGRADTYGADRNDPGADRTSRLSAALKYGCVHPRQALRRLDGTNRSHDRFASELAWRDFYADVLDAWPESAWHPFNPAMAEMRYDTGRRADERFAAWAEGRTGYPIVDAGMRQLVGQGWVHNRVRMVTASFLVKDLHIDPFRGARHFLHHLVDGDLPSNNHGWQWVAGTGTDPSPYYRIFNPVKQSKKFDPDGVYLRRWVPELHDVDDRHVHEPWTAPDGPPPGYPGPIVDHDTERKEALARYGALRG